jgi:hypothetical protein
MHPEVAAASSRSTRAKLTLRSSARYRRSTHRGDSSTPDSFRGHHPGTGDPAASKLRLAVMGMASSNSRSTPITIRTQPHADPRPGTAARPYDPITPIRDSHLRRTSDRLRGGSDAPGGAGRDAARRPRELPPSASSWEDDLLPPETTACPPEPPLVASVVLCWHDRPMSSPSSPRSISSKCEPDHLQPNIPMIEEDDAEGHGVTGSPRPPVD